jgi:NAD(P)-dependent dehydrogenase (short-subunit alcohol dehydrogenase family)
VTVLITGAGSGIGAAIARRLAHRERIIVTDINQDAAEEVARGITSLGHNARARRLDVTDESAIGDLFRELNEDGVIDGLVCNAGMIVRGGIEEISTADWRRMMNVNVRSAFLCVRAALPGMIAAGRGRVLLMSSDFAVMGMAAAPAYAAAKTAVYSLTKSLALECAPYDVRVNALGPGPIDTPLLRSGRTGESWTQAEKVLRAGVPMNRLGMPEEVASVAAYLMSDAATYITGQIVHPNGGQLMW